MFPVTPLKSLWSRVQVYFGIPVISTIIFQVLFVGIFVPTLLVHKVHLF